MIIYVIINIDTHIDNANPEARMKSALELAREIPANPQVVAILEDLENDAGKTGNVAYLPGLSEGMVAAGNLFYHLHKMLESGQVQEIAVSGSDGRGWGEGRDFPTAAWPGVVWYMDELLSLGVPRRKIVPIIAGPQRQSLQETEALLRQAKNLGWERVVVVSVDYHRARQALGIVQQMNRDPSLLRRVYFPSLPFDWDAEMLGSQNTRMSTGREEAIVDWNDKIPLYQAKGDLASLNEFQEYIRWRDSE